ncbi:hypothetical protein NP493_91g01005 [Ridgeia piscesae]|uniref:non-specific serine/threonine protein kinase n=1 Tax=Ridgeia piscesae TaxID=27915 RepID=A0AAD9UI36_RIDPI|nr:hypothetical protein NP493_91g01005 [Ridgeia piscesae]
MFARSGGQSTEAVPSHSNDSSTGGHRSSGLLSPFLELLEDSEYDVRLAFSKTIPYVIGACCCSDGDTRQVDEVIVTKLKMAVKVARFSSNVSLIETILLTVGELGRVASSDLLLVMVIILLDMISSPFCPLAAAVARQQLKEIARKKTTKLQHLFLQFGRSICKVLVEHLHEAQHEQKVQDIIAEVADAFQFTDVKDFLTRTEHLLLPHLVKKATTTASALLRTISKQLGDPNHKGPLARNIRHIFCHLVCSCQPDELVRTCTYLEAESEWDLGSLLRFGQNVDSELLLHLGTHYDQVLTGIKILASKSGKYQCTSENITTDHLSKDITSAMLFQADLLQLKLLGILVHFDNHLNNGTITVKEKKQTYKSLISLIQLMGPKHITTVRVRLMTTLKIGLVFKESGFPELCAKAWNCFVHSVDVQSLGPMLSQILVSLLPLLRQRPKQVAEIFSYLIVDNRRIMSTHFHELYFLPDIAELKDVNAVLKHYTDSSHRFVNTVLKHYTDSSHRFVNTVLKHYTDSSHRFVNTVLKHYTDSSHRFVNTVLKHYTDSSHRFVNTVLKHYTDSSHRFVNTVLKHYTDSSHRFVNTVLKHYTDSSHRFVNTVLKHYTDSSHRFVNTVLKHYTDSSHRFVNTVLKHYTDSSHRFVNTVLKHYTDSSHRFVNTVLKHYTDSSHRFVNTVLKHYTDSSHRFVNTVLKHYTDSSHRFVNTVLKHYTDSSHRFVNTVLKPYTDSSHRFVNTVLKHYTDSSHRFVNTVLKHYTDSSHRFVNTVLKHYTDSSHRFVNTVLKHYTDSSHRFVSTVLKHYTDSSYRFVNTVLKHYTDSSHRFVNTVLKHYTDSSHRFVSTVLKHYTDSSYRFVNTVLKPYTDSSHRFVNTVLKHYTDSSHSSPNLKTTIEHLLKGISHESVDVRLLALSKLKTLLHNNQESLHQLVLTGENADPIVSHTVAALLRGCRAADQNTRCLYAECLGQLGAIDPGRLDFLTSQSKEELGQFVATVIDDNFATELITELTKAFLRAEDRNTQDCVAFAIQELIQIYGITNDDPVASGSEGSRLWQRFSEEVHEIMAPLMHSRYRLTLKYNWSQLVTPIYRSKKGTKFDSWVSTLAGYLSSKTKEEKPKRVFDACRGVIRNDSQMALYLLPHIVIHNLLGGDDSDHEQICSEILAVLQHAREDDTRHGDASDLRHICGQTVFSLLDHLTKWTRHRIKTLSVKTASSRGVRSVSVSDLTFSQDESYRRVSSFLKRIPQDILARASYNCNAYTRSLMHHELFIRSRAAGPVQDDLDFLQKLYMSLDEPDGVTGMTAIKQTQPTLTEQIIAFESIGQLSDASVCYDHAIRSQPDDLSLRHGLLRCRLALGELNSVMELTNGIISQNPSSCRQLNTYRVEAAWRLGQWDRLEGYLKHEDNSQSWNVSLSRILLAAKCQDEAAYVRHLHLVRNDLMGPLSAASMEMGSYHRGYEYIVRLHMLNELEQCFLTLMDFPSKSTRGQLGAVGVSSPVGDVTVSTEGPSIEFASLVQQWHSRLKFSQNSGTNPNLASYCVGAVLSWTPSRQGHRSMLVTDGTDRKKTAQSSLLSASAYKLPEFCIENAKWLWDRGDYDKAQMCLEKGIEEYYPDRTTLRADSSQESHTERQACAKVLLLLGNYCEETASWESNAIMRQYKEVIKVHSEWEDGYFHIAKYYDKIMTNLIESDRPEKKGEFVIQVVQYFGQSLLHGNQYIYQSMPRMLTLWLDYGAEVTEAESRSKSEAILQGMRTVLQHLNKLMSGFSQKLAPYQFLTAFPQLISRICHTHVDVFHQLKDITARLLASFPQQAMWLMMAVSKSSFQTRVKRCQEIFGLARSMNRDLAKFILDATKLTERLLDLCNKHIDGSTAVLSLSQHFKPLKRLVEDRHFSRVMLPLQSLMVVSLPSVDITPASHSPFPGTPVYIAGIEDTIEVLPSLARPKKITMLGSDGQLYTMLCKPKDDLRKDARLMEFNSIVNRCLHQNAEARRRDLHIRTFTVTPLNEECGLLEWVSHTRGIRPILLQLYKERGIYTTAKELKSLQLPPGAPLQKKLDIFKQKLLPKHPALFSDWFLKTFPDPTA